MTKLQDDGYCFACGPKNPHGLVLSFSSSAQGVRALFTPGKTHQGYKDIVHGGIITAVLDEAMVKAVIQKGLAAVTAEITVRFKSPLMVGETVSVEAKADKMGDKLIEASATLIRVSDGKMIAAAKGKLLITA